MATLYVQSLPAAADEVSARIRSFGHLVHLLRSSARLLFIGWEETLVKELRRSLELLFER